MRNRDGKTSVGGVWCQAALDEHLTQNRVKGEVCTSYELERVFPWWKMVSDITQPKNSRLFYV